MRTLTIHLTARQAAALSIGALAIAAAAATRMGDVATLAASFVAFCGDLIAYRVGPVGPARAAGLVAAAILALSAARAAVFLVVGAARAAALRARIRERAVPATGKVTRAAAAARTAIPTVIADTDAYAFTFGVIRPAVTVSSALVAQLTLRELTAVLRHEEAHRRAADPLRTAAAELLRTAFFWLPASRDIATHGALRRELAADRAAMTGKDGRRALAAALLKTTAPAATMPGIVAFGHLSHRVDALAFPSDRTPFRIPAPRFAATVGILAALLVAGGNAGAATAEDASARLCTDAVVLRTASPGYTPFVLIRTEAAPMSEAGQSTPDVR
jgi:beta-lactamase regulating signal transducer with metallopeptidase domain